MKTQDKNKIIAEFMGYKFQDGCYEIPKFGYIKMNGDWTDIFTPSTLKFHSDWNWLMEAISKCRVESNEEDSHWEAIYYSLVGLDINVVHNAAFNFVQWYNLNKI